MILRINPNNKNYKQVIYLMKENLPENLHVMFGSQILKVYIKKVLINNINSYGYYSKKLQGLIILGKDDDINNFLLNNFLILFLHKFFLFLFLGKFKKIYRIINTFIFFFKKKCIPSNSIELIHIAVNKNFQNKKIGTILINYSLNKLKNKFDYIFAKIDPNNKKVVNFYKKNNFKKFRLINGRLIVLRKL